MHKMEQHYREVHNLLLPLERVFDESLEAQKYRSFFREELDANELGVALHAICDFLLGAYNDTNERIRRRPD